MPVVPGWRFGNIFLSWEMMKAKRIGLDCIGSICICMERSSANIYGLDEISVYI